MTAHTQRLLVEELLYTITTTSLQRHSRVHTDPNPRRDSCSRAIIRIKRDQTEDDTMIDVSVNISENKTQ
jgi:hypothetical protein